MTRARLLLAVASVLAGAAVLFVVLGAAFNLVLVAAALPFGLAAYFLWLHATGRLEARVRSRAVGLGARARERRREEAAARGGARERASAWSARTGRRAGRAPGGRAAGEPPADDPRAMDRREALQTLGLSPDADQATIRRAYRERVKAVHPDASDGDEAAFRRLTAAYRQLRDR